MSEKSREQRKNEVIDALNQARAGELQAIHQYMNQHYNLDNMDYGELAANLKLIAIDEMRHAEQFAERIKELGGEPVSEPAAAIQKGQNLELVFSFDADLEDDTIDQYNRFLLVCRENGDNLSVKLLETIIAEEQIHYNYFDNVKDHLRKLGESYLARIAGTPADTGPPSKGFVMAKGGA